MCIYHFPTSVICPTRLIAQDSVLHILSRCSTEHFKVRFIGDWVKWKPKSVGKKNKTFGRCRHTTSSAWVTNAYFVWHIWLKHDKLQSSTEIVYTKGAVKFFNVVIWSSYVVLHSYCLLFTDLLTNSVCLVDTSIENNHQINDPRCTREALTNSVPPQGINMTRHTMHYYHLHCAFKIRDLRLCVCYFTHQVCNMRTVDTSQLTHTSHKIHSNSCVGNIEFPSLLFRTLEV